MLQNARTPRRARAAALSALCGLAALFVGCSGHSVTYDVSVFVTVPAGGAPSAVASTISPSLPAEAPSAPDAGTGDASKPSAAGDAGAAGETSVGGSASDAGVDAGARVSLNATAHITIIANLDADVWPLVTWNINDPPASSDFSTDMSVYAENGDVETLDVYFVKVAQNSHAYYVVAQGSDLSPLVLGDVEIGTGTLYFDDLGSLERVIVDKPIEANFVGNTSPQPIQISFANTTQFQAPANVSFQSQDGYFAGAGHLGDRCSVDDDCEFKSCVQHTCFCGEGCACQHDQDCSNIKDVCAAGVCTYGD